jgi:hypothetical protein
MKCLNFIDFLRFIFLNWQWLKEKFIGNVLFFINQGFVKVEIGNELPERLLLN